MKNLLTNRKWQVDGNWYNPRYKLKEFKSVVYAEYINTSSSAGDWDGLFIQKISNRSYAIPFFQKNNYPGSGFTLYTGELFRKWKGYLEPERVAAWMADS
jgi:hypothetical protein